MKKIITIILVSVLIFASCAEPKFLTIDGTKTIVEPYGLANTVTKNDKVAYQVSMGNVVWSILGIENVIVPVILIGWYLYEPVEVIEE